MTTSDSYTGTTPAFNITALPADLDLVRIMRDEIVQHPDTAPCWMISHGDRFPMLAVGLRGEVGALMWDLGTSALVPVEGRNTTDADYFLGNRDHSPFPPGTELPAEQVLAAVDEYVRTRQRPTCVEWQPEGQG